MASGGASSVGYRETYGRELELVRWNRRGALGRLWPAGRCFVPAFELEATGNDFPWEVFGSASYPGEPAISGAGSSIVATSSACGPVLYTERPEDYVGRGNEAMQATGERGNLEVCAGCITQTCDELVP